MVDLTLEDIEFIKILANFDSTILQTNMNEIIRYRLDAQIGEILRDYHKENTTNTKTLLTKKFERAGITKDDGKAAIACARRLGIDIS